MTVSDREGPSRMSPWGRMLLVAGALLLVLAGLASAGRVPRLDAAYAPVAAWLALAALGAGGLLAGLGVLEQRLIEQRRLIEALLKQRDGAEGKVTRFQARRTGKS